MRKLALDIGDVRIGIAISDPLCIIASPYETYTRNKDKEKDYLYIASIVKLKECDTIVIGLPINMDGSSGKRVELVHKFGDELKNYTDADIDYCDERLSTVEAEQMLIQADMRRDKRKQVVDKIAAAIILTSYLDSNKVKESKKMSKELEKGLIEENEIMDDEDIVTLTNDKGEDVDFYHIATLDYKDNWYIFLSPVEGDEELSEEEVIIFRLSEDEEGNEVFNPLESDEEANAVYEVYLKELENCDEEECNCADESCDCGCNCCE